MPLAMSLNDVHETSECRENQESPSEIQASTDVPDGIFRPGRKGRYRPRIEEMESWGRPIGTLSYQAESEVCLLALLRVDPVYRWRSGLTELLHKCRDGEECHKALFFLYAIVAEGLRAQERGVGETVDFNPCDAPENLSCADCLSIIHGLNFVTTSPGTVRNISYVDVQTGPNTDQTVLKGFCCLLKCLGSLAWENLQDILKLEEDNGLHLYHTASHLNNGYGLEHNSRKLLETLHTQYPELLLDLGFMFREGQNAKWQKPKNAQVFENVITVLYMLFATGDNIETAI